MAYATLNPPVIYLQAFTSTAPAIWLYTSADDQTTMDGAGYITDAGKRGMKVGDLVIVTETVTNTTTIHRCTSVNAWGTVNTPGDGATNLAS